MSAFTGIWLPKIEHRVQVYKQACKDVLKNDLKDFKRHSKYTSFIANDIRDIVVAREFYYHLKFLIPSLLDLYESKFSLNDRIGSPNLYIFDGIRVSPGTLRFIKVLSDVIRFFPPDKIQNIIEIGSGYGGQCLIFRQWKPEINYTLVDIPESLAVANRYLLINNIEHKFISTENIQVENEYDVCISDYCLSEMDKDGVQFYLDTVLSKCQFAYITSNSIGQPLQDLMDQLGTVFTVVRAISEEPKTSFHDNSIIMCWK